MSEPLDRLESLFATAMQRPPADRAAYLDRVCADQPALRQRVEALLAAHDAAGSFLQPPEAKLCATIEGPPAGERPGTAIGPYKLLEMLGEGGMGTVWLAQQQEPVKRLVALKLIRPGLDSAQVIARFEQERQALALMDHPNIAKVHDGGATPEGRPYFVMELVRGVPITQFCDEHKLTLRQRLELFVGVCQAVQHAHHKGVIHRDLKPSNVLVALYDGQPVPKVIDFGVAKAAGQLLTEKTLVTGCGALIGTPEYMSPEQAELNNLDIDTRSDVYSLGALLYELLTGSPPFSRKEMEQVGLLEMLRLVREQEPTRPSNKLSTAEGLPTLAANRGTGPAGLISLLSGEPDWIVMKALEKDRNRRYETANAFALDVQRFLNDEPVAAGPPSPWYRFRKFAQRNLGKIVVAAGASLAVLVMVASVGWALRDRAAQQAEAEFRAREGFDVARTLIAENKLFAARQRLAEVRAQLGNARPGQASLAAEVEAAEAELDRLQRFLGLLDRAHQAELTLRLDPRLAKEGRAVAQPLASGADERRAAAAALRLEALGCYAALERDDWVAALEGGLLGGDQVEQLRRAVYEELLWLADDLAGRQQDHGSGEKLSRKAAARAAIVHLGKAERALPPTQALYVLRARCREALGEEAAAQADRQLADKTPPTLAVDHYQRGRAAYQAKKLAEGVQALEAALRLEPTHYWSLMGLGACLCDLGRGPEDFAGAARVFTGCILHRPDHAHAYRCRGHANLKLGQYEKAVADYSKAIELGPKDAKDWYNRGVAYDNLRQYEKAVADFTQAIALGPKHVNAWTNRGAVYDNHLGQHDKAVADFTQAIALGPKYVLAWYNRGAAYSNLGQHAKAVADFSRAIDLDPKYTDAWNGRGIVYCDHLGQPAKAVADFSRAIELGPKDAKAWHCRGVAYDNLRQYEKAVADFTQAIELGPKLVSAWYNRGAVYGKQGQLDKAVADFTQAIKLGPKFAKAWCGRGAVYSDHLSQHDKAVADFTQAIELGPKHVSAWYNRGAVYGKQGQLDKAVADFTQAIALGPKDADAWYNRGLAYGKQGQLDKAVADYEKVLKLAPTNAWAHNSLAWLLATCPDANRRDPDRAVRLAKKAVELAPKVGACWNTLGVAHYRAGDWKAAVAALDRSVELRRGGDASDHLFLAMAYRKLDKNDESRKAYKQALQWLEKNEKSLSAGQAEDLRRFRREAEAVLELKKK